MSFEVDPAFEDLLNRMNEQQEKANSFFAPPEMIQKPANKGWFTEPDPVMKITTIRETIDCTDEDKVFAIDVVIYRIVDRNDKTLFFHSCIDASGRKFQVVSFRESGLPQNEQIRIKVKIPKANATGNPAYRLQ